MWSCISDNILYNNVIYYFQMELANICVCLLIGLGFVLLYKTLTVFYGLSSVSGRSSVVVGLHLQLNCERVGDPWHDIPNPALPYETAGPLPSPLLGQGEWQKCAAFCQNHWLILSFYVMFRWTNEVNFVDRIILILSWSIN